MSRVDRSILECAVLLCHASDHSNWLYPPCDSLLSHHSKRLLYSKIMIIADNISAMIVVPFSIRFLLTH